MGVDLSQVFYFFAMQRPHFETYTILQLVVLFYVISACLLITPM